MSTKTKTKPVKPVKSVKEYASDRVFNGTRPVRKAIADHLRKRAPVKTAKPVKSAKPKMMMTAREAFQLCSQLTNLAVSVAFGVNHERGSEGEASLARRLIAVGHDCLKHAGAK